MPSTLVTSIRWLAFVSLAKFTTERGLVMELLTITLSIVSAIVILCLRYYWSQTHICLASENIPGPPGYPFIGNALMIFTKPADIIPTIVKLIEKYGPVIQFWAGPYLFIFVKDPNDVQLILGDQNVNVKNPKTSSFIGNGLFTIRSEECKIHRELITQSFNFNISESYVKVFGRKSETLLKKLEGTKENVFDVYNFLAPCLMEAICETVIGSSITSQSNFAGMMHKHTTCIRKRCARPWLWPGFIYSRTEEGQRGISVMQKADKLMKKMIAEKMEEYRRGVATTPASNKKVVTFVDRLIEASEKGGSILSAEEIQAEMLMITGAGFETTAATMCFFLVLIALHPEVQAELQTELDDLFGASSRPATYEQLHKLPVMERCIDETLRLFPVAGFATREIVGDVHLPSGFILPAGSSAVLLPYVTHRDGQYFSDPLKFLPDRWISENTRNTLPYAYIPFGRGPRNCVGQKYAMLQMKSFLSQVLRCYQVTSPLTMELLQRLEVSMTLSLQPVLDDERYLIQVYKR